MIKMKLKIGQRKKALEFISNLKEKDRIVLISHNDIDGIVCAKIMNKVVNPEKIMFVNYDKFDLDLVFELKNKKFNKIIFTDINVKKRTLVQAIEKFADVLIIDHHISKDFNSGKTVFILGEEGYSAGYLCYDLFSKIKNLEKFDWLVACSCLSDYCHIKPQKWLEKVFVKYGDKLEYENTYVRKSGVFWDLTCKLSNSLSYFGKDLEKVYDFIGEDFGEIGDLGKYSYEVEKEIQRQIKNFEKNHEKFDLGYFLEVNPKFKIRSVLSTILSGKEIDKFYILVQSKKDIYGINVRRQDKKFSCVEFLGKLLKDLEETNFGGHVPAAGGWFKKEDLPEVRRRLGLK